MTIIRRPAVAGKFYPLQPQNLENEIRQMLVAVEVVKCRPKILIAPHAGYEYSGEIAASAYATIEQHRAAIRRVVILGTCHTSPDPLIFTTGADSFETPLGAVTTDKASVQLAVHHGLAVVDDEAHRYDHAIEVQLPFLQTVLDSFVIAPFLISNAPAHEVAGLTRLLWGGPETLFVISSDLSHYLPYEEACTLDQQTADRIKEMDHESLDRSQACGSCAIAGALQVAREKSLRCRQLDLRNSGDTGGPSNRVVGYGAFAFISQT